MKNFIDTIKNIWKIQELRERILITLGFLLVYRLGSFVVLPGIDPAGLEDFSSKAQDGLMGLLNIFTGGAFSKASILALGIMPYISASIVVQLMGMAVPYLQKLQKEGESGRNKLNQLTRYLTVLITLAQAPSFLAALPVEAIVQFESGMVTTMFAVLRGLILVTGTMFAMWLGEKITDRGVGNGISLLIMIGIIASLPQSFAAEWDSVVGQSSGGLIKILVELILLLFVILLSVLLVQGVRRIPVQYAKRVAGQQYSGVRQYIPLKVNAAGVMPIIFAQAIMFIPITVAGFASDGEDAGWLIREFSNFAGFWYNFVFALMIIVFTYFYTAITVNTNQMADDMKRNGGFVPGIKPGKETSDYLDAVMSKIVFPGSLFLAFLSIIPAFAMMAGVNDAFSRFFGGTSLLIMVGVVLDTLQQIESYLLNRHYDGLMQTGRIQGRSAR